MLPELQSIWQATDTAAGRLDAELPFPLSSLLADAIAALEKRSFEERIPAVQTKARGRA
jgi:hypothetical protein